MSNQRERKKDERKFPIKEWEKEKRKERKFLTKEWEKVKKKKTPGQRNQKKCAERSLDQTISEHIRNCHQMNKKEGKETMTKSGLLPLITNQNPVRRGIVRLAQNQNRKGKSQQKIKSQKHTKAEKPIKKTHSQGKSY